MAFEMKFREGMVGSFFLAQEGFGIRRAIGKLAEWRLPIWNGEIRRMKTT
jgi:hypothetical protein